MSEPAATPPAAPAAQPTTPTTPAPKPPGFTRELTATPSATPAATTAAPVPAAAQTPEALVTALAKAGSSERLTKKQNETLQAQIKDLTTQLEAKKEIEGKLTESEKRYLNLLDNPKLLLSHEKWSKAEKGAFAAILEEFARDDEPENPRLTAIEQELADRKAKDAKGAEDKVKRDAENETAEETRLNEAARSNILALMKEEGVKPDATGNPRWALISDDTGAAERARTEALKFAQGHGKPGDKDYRAPFIPTNDEAKDLVCQALDLMESDARKETETRAAKLKRQTSPMDRTGFTSGFTTQQQYPTEEKQTPTIDANLRGSPLPAPRETFRHGFTRQ